jgi:hypothetical protein
MPMLYGEGRKAFQRLQEEILRISSDLSIFAWRSSGPPPSWALGAPVACSVLASAVADFAQSGGLLPLNPVWITDPDVLMIESRQCTDDRERTLFSSLFSFAQPSTNNDIVDIEHEQSDPREQWH